MDFMEKNPDIAKGFIKRDKPLVDSLWLQLAESLNSAGPPHKDVTGWKKIWSDWKGEIRLKEVESHATGGGPFSKKLLTQTEEAIVRICGIAKSVEGVPGESFGPAENAEAESEEIQIQSDDELPSTSSKRKVDAFEPSSTPKRSRKETSASSLKKFLNESIDIKIVLNSKMDQIVKAQKENANNSRRVYRAIEKGNEAVAKAINGLQKEIVSLSYSFSKAMHEKNEIKKKQLDLDYLKYELKKK